MERSARFDRQTMSGAPAAERSGVSSSPKGAGKRRGGQVEKSNWKVRMWEAAGATRTRGADTLSSVERLTMVVEAETVDGALAIANALRSSNEVLGSLEVVSVSLEL